MKALNRKNRIAMRQMSNVSDVKLSTFLLSSYFANHLVTKCILADKRNSLSTSIAENVGTKIFNKHNKEERLSFRLVSV